MRRFRDGTFNVVIDPTAWRQVSVIPREDFRAIQDKLQERARRLANEVRTDSLESGPLHITVEGYVVVCQIEVELHTLRLMVVRRADQS